MNVENHPQLSNSLNVIHYHRTELAIILSLYGRMVAAGEWRDYGMSGHKDVAIFSEYPTVTKEDIGMTLVGGTNGNSRGSDRKRNRKRQKKKEGSVGITPPQEKQARTGRSISERAADEFA